MPNPSFASHPSFPTARLSRKKPPTCCVSGRPSSQEAKKQNEAPTPNLNLLLGTNQILSRIFEEGVSAADSAQQVFDSAMSALGVSYNSPEDEYRDDVAVPTEPSFDPVLAAYLALYAFRSYEAPPPACYREVRETSFLGIDDTPETIVNYFAYPDSKVLARSMDGVFLLKIQQSEAKDDNGASNLFFVLRINESLLLDFIKTRNFTLMRKRAAVAGLGAAVDECIVLAYDSEYAYNNGQPPLLKGSVFLSSVVRKGHKMKGKAQWETFEFTLNKVRQESDERDGFDLSRFPEQFRLPFAKIQQVAEEYMKKDAIKPIRLSLEASYVPHQNNSDNNKGGWWRKLTKGEKNVRQVKKNDKFDASALDRALSETIPEGELPLPSSWANLAKGVREIAKEHGSERKSNTVDDSIPQALFIESVSTNTQVWLFHDEEGDLIISFRGTETNEWMDFVTDAQMFLHKWEPGGDIDLEVTEENSVGVAEVAGAIAAATGISISTKKKNNNSNGTTSAGGNGVEEDASCVHYGFLSAYHSVRDAVRHGIEVLTEGKLETHRFYFVGHSLGGALSTLCAADFAFFNPPLRDRISCISYGAPKAGNAGFAYRYNLLVHDSFRIVNDADIVTRMPKSIGARPCERYRHVGRTVLINDRGEYWIEGEDADNSNRNSDNSQEIHRISKAAIDPFRERYTDANALIAYEQEMWASLITGKSLKNHMEDSYFLAMTEVLRRTFQASNEKK